MRKGHLLFSAVEFLIVAALFLIGAAFFSLHFSLQARELFADWILSGGGSFFLIGILISAMALFFAICFGMMQKGSFIRLKAKGFSLEEALIRNATMEFWSQEFPDERLPKEIYCSAGKIEIITENLKVDLDELEGRLGFFLSKSLGYDRDFYITLTRH